MLTLSNAKQQRLIYAIFILYTSVYLAKLNYNALLVEILNDLGGSRSAAGMVGSFFFFSYGIGQVVNGFFAKYMNEKIVMTLSLFGSAVCNILMCLAPSISIMKYIWLLNGAVMSPLWCNVVKVQGKYIDQSNLPKALTISGLTTPLGTAINYGVCALIVRFSTWQVSFWLAGGLMLIMAVMWYAVISDIELSAGPLVESEKQTETTKEPKIISEKLSVAVLFTLIILFVTGMFTQFTRDGLNAWVPSILYEVYNIPATLSIALTLFMPLLSCFSNFILVALERKSKDFLVLSIVFVGVASLFMAVLVSCYSLNSVVITFGCFIIISLCCAAIANITTNHLPLYYRDRFDPGRMAGIGQGACYIGSTLSTYTLGYVADKGGWYNVFLMLGVVIFASLVLCIAVKLFTKERYQHPRFIH